MFRKKNRPLLKVMVLFICLYILKLIYVGKNELKSGIIKQNEMMQTLLVVNRS
jgi:hypothetical protein